MHNSTSPGRKKIGLIAAMSTLSIALAGGTAFFSGITPARAASIASQPDAQVAVFMVPLTLLVLLMLFEAARFVRRGALPAQMPVGRPHRPPLSPRKKNS